MRRRRQAYKSDDKIINDKDKEQPNKDQENQIKKNRGEWSSTDMKNELFEKFYKSIVPNEFEQFMAALRRDLPTSMRISWCSFPDDERMQQFLSGLAADLNSSIAFAPADSSSAATAVAAASSAPPASVVRQLGFIPGAIDAPELSRSDLKRSLGHRSAKTVIQALSEAGLLSRQEVVSMVPPLLLDVQPGNTVLDLCAAPGSKTLQCLERLVRGPCGGASTTTSQGGCVVANDVNAGRLDVLLRQAGRSPFAASHLIVCNHDARFFPITAGVRFDRVLCDTMCSGDGTLRKSPDLWQRWTPNSGAALHTQQRTVLYRGMQLCKAGGIVVYSTCSMNPIEDEAVVAACLKDAGGSFELIDPRTQLPNLRFYPGLRDWGVMRADGSYCESPSAVNNTAASSPADKKYIVPSMFPDFAAKGTPNIEYCCRVVPHLQDTGGFFIAAMRCKSELRSKKEERRQAYADKQLKQEDAVEGKQEAKVENNDGDDDDDAAAANTAKTAACTDSNKNNNSGAKPIVTAAQKPDGYGPISEASRKEIQQHMLLPATFPFQCLYSRHELSREPKAYFVAGAAPSLMQQMDAKVVGLGVRAFESTTKRSFGYCRFSVEGAAVVAPFVPNLVVSVDATVAFDAIKNFMTDKMKLQQQQAASNNNNNNNSVTNTMKQYETINVPVTKEQRAHVTAGARSVLLRIQMGPHLLRSADVHAAGRVLVVPGEVDYTGASGHVATRMTLNHMALLAYSLGGMDGVAQWNELCGINSNNLNNNDNNNNIDPEDDDDEANNNNNGEAGNYSDDPEQPKPANSAAAMTQ